MNASASVSLNQYLKNQWDGITADANARRLGAIEGQNGHVLARRMKQRGASWTERGARHLARLSAARANGALDRYVRPPGGVAKGRWGPRPGCLSRA